jgi:EmrB/QacA subfamily drug resistance transporter
VINAYLLMFAGFLLLGGRLADRFGRRRMFQAGLMLFSAASLACGLAPNAAALVVARAAQGLGGAIAAPAALALLTTTFADDSQRTRALAAWGAVAGAGGAAGVVLGGLVTDLLSWPWIFFLNVPIGASVIALAPALLPAGRSRHQTGADRPHLDVPGAATVTAGLALLVYALISSPDYGWNSIHSFACLAAAGVLLVAFVAIESRGRDPMVPLGVFRQRQFSGAYGVALLFSASLISTFTIASLYMQQVLRYSPLEAGLASLASPLLVIVIASRAGSLVNRFGITCVLTIGLSVSMLARIWLAYADVHGTYLITLLPGLLAAGVGIGLTVVPVTMAAMSGGQTERAGVTAGLLNTSQQVGGALGVAVLAAVAATRTRTYRESHPAQPASLLHALVSGYDAAFLAAAVLITAALLVAIIALRDRRSARDDAHHSHADRT